MIVEYRSSSGSAAFKAINGERVSLRSLGCPDWLVKKVIERRKLKSGHEAAPVHVAPTEPQADADALRDRLHSVSLL
jgi:hypothetical protein